MKIRKNQIIAITAILIIFALLISIITIIFSKSDNKRIWETGFNSIESNNLSSENPNETVTPPENKNDFSSTQSSQNSQNNNSNNHLTEQNSNIDNSVNNSNNNNLGNDGNNNNNLAEQSNLFEPLYKELKLIKGDFNEENGKHINSENCCYITNYKIKKGHILSTKNSNYRFFIHELNSNNYLENLTTNTLEGDVQFIAPKDMTIAVRVKKYNNEEITSSEINLLILRDVLYGMLTNKDIISQKEISLKQGTFDDYTGQSVTSSVYACIIPYTLKSGHTLSINNTDYLFNIRQKSNNNFTSQIRVMDNVEFTNTTGKDIVIAIRVRNPKSTPLTKSEIDSIKIIDTLYNECGINGYAHRFTVNAEKITGGTEKTRAVLFMPPTYSAKNSPSPLVMMTHGYNGYLSDSDWYGNTVANANLIHEYLTRGYGVFVVNNTAQSDIDGEYADLGCPQLVDSLFKAYEYICNNFNVEKKFYIHGRSFGNFAAIRVMLERPELVKCALITGPRASLKWAYDRVNKPYFASRFGFSNPKGTTYEKDKLIGYDPLSDSAKSDYVLPPTFWMFGNDDPTEDPNTVINNLIKNGCDVEKKTYNIIHSQATRLADKIAVKDAFAFYKKHQ